jgi:DNA-binding SARP family transcriptional activator
MEFRILGSLYAGETADLSQRLQRHALAILLLRAGQSCSRSWLIDALWGDQPPNSADSAFRSCIYRLRRNLGDSGGRLETRPDGYRMAVAPGELDLDAFRDLAGQGSDALDKGDAAAAASALTAALALWGDPPLPDLPDTPLVNQQRTRLLDHLRSAGEDLVDAKLALGQHQQVIPALRAAVTDDPLREHAWAQLMLALYRSGRKAEALTAATDARSTLVRELGVGLGPELKQLVALILDDDPALAAVRGSVLPISRPSWTPVCQLPADLMDFAGRPGDVETVRGILLGRGVPVALVTGDEGAGKTRLAVHVGHLARRVFPDGQLFVELSDGCRARRALDIIGGVLRGLGLPECSLPPDLPDRAAMYRSLLAGLRVLVVADGATTAAQVQPLIPGTPGSAVVVTARRAMPQLEGATPVRLAPNAVRQLPAHVSGGRSVAPCSQVGGHRGRRHDRRTWPASHAAPGRPA